MRKKGDVACYIELHIEQGGMLEQAGLQIGVVEGHRRAALVRGDHRRLRQPCRHDADGPAARRDARRREVHRRGQRRDHERARAGRSRRWAASPRSPNTTNVIPGQVVLTVDLRDLDAGKLGALHDARSSSSDARSARRPARPSRSRRLVGQRAGDRRPAGHGLDRRERRGARPDAAADAERRRARRAGDRAALRRWG